MTDLESRVTEIVSLILDVPADQIATADDVAPWDSLAHLNIVASLEQEFGIQISPEESRKLRSISKICAFISRSS
jgi:acyl carrier protein